ncbi:hypothetical protein LTS18_004769, partial [Coniosporium uncinatum]
MPDNLESLDECSPPPPDVDEEHRFSSRNIEQRHSDGRHSGKEDEEDDVEEEAEEAGFGGLDELEAPEPDENPEGRQWYRRESLEERRSRSEERSRISQRTDSSRETKRSEVLIQMYTYGWLILFSILGTLARLGTQWITNYPNAPVTTSEMWANFGGCFILGFLQEDRALFAKERRKPRKASSKPRRGSDSSELEQHKGKDELSQLQTDLEKRKAGAEHLHQKKTMPLYIGLAVGFCGSYTSYSSFMRDAFLALSNDPLAKNPGPAARSGGWSVCAVLAVLVAEIAVSMAALSAGAHFSEFTAPLLFKLPKTNTARFLNPVGVFLGFGCWLCAVLLAIWPPQNRWRQDCIFALIFAPLGCILRFLLATRLNGKIAKFPLGTFTANVFGSLVLAVAYDLQRAPLPSAGGLVGGVSKFLFGDSSKESILEVPQGQLYLVRPLSVKGYSELIFKDAAASIRRTGQPFQYQLVIQRAYEEGEEELVADEDGDEGTIDGLGADKDEKTFLLDESLQFRTDIRQTGEKVFAWNDLSGDRGDLWEFVCDHKTPAETVGHFEIVALECQYERKYRRDRGTATEEDLKEFVVNEEPIPEASPIHSPNTRSPALSPSPSSA